MLKAVEKGVVARHVVNITICTGKSGSVRLNTQVTRLFGSCCDTLQLAEGLFLFAFRHRKTMKGRQQ
jgi:hypothetical protein